MGTNHAGIAQDGLTLGGDLWDQDLPLEQFGDVLGNLLNLGNELGKERPFA
jgi:hypothetical protein